MATVATAQGPKGQGARAAISRLFDDTRRRLVETGTRNRLIHVNRANTRGNLLNIVNERSDHVHAMLSSGKAMKFLATGRDRDEDLGEIAFPNAAHENLDEEQLETRLGADALQRKLLKIARETQTAEEESSVNILYIAMGFLTWFEDDASKWRGRRPSCCYRSTSSATFARRPTTSACAKRTL